MEFSMILLFVVGYLAIALEHVTKINKAAVSLLMTAILWSLYALISPAEAPVQILHQLGEVSSIVCFIFGAMVVVELVDSYGGFSLVAYIIKAKILEIVIGINKLFDLSFHKRKTCKDSLAYKWHFL